MPPTTRPRTPSPRTPKAKPTTLRPYHLTFSDGTDTILELTGFSVPTAGGVLLYRGRHLVRYFAPGVVREIALVDGERLAPDAE